MSKTKVLARPNRWRRLIELFLISVALVTLVITTQRWTTFARTTTYPGGGTGTVDYHVGTMIVFLLILPSLLISLSWSEQRWLYAVLEVFAIWLGLVVAFVGPIVSLWVGQPADLLRGCIALLIGYILVRSIALVVVRFFLFSIVYGRGLCTRCGYDLTGNLSGICPECGIAITAIPCEPRP